MSQKLPPEKKKKPGRKRLYDPQKHPKIAADLALMGKTNIEIAEALGVNQDTIHKWRIEYPEFSDAIKKNKDQADSVVITSLYKRACGYEYTETREIHNPDESVRKEIIIKHVPPDPTSMIFWLKNRQSKDWRDKQILEHGGTDGQPIKISHEYILVKGVDPPARR